MQYLCPKQIFLFKATQQINLIDFSTNSSDIKHILNLPKTKVFIAFTHQKKSRSDQEITFY